LADPAREVVLHAAEYDVMCLKREWGLTLGRIFDTHAAAKVLGIERVGLGNLLSDELGVLLTEDEQRSDWGRRPLSPEQLAYAFADVQHLLALRERMGVRLSERGLLSEAEAEFARLTAKEPRPRQLDAEVEERYEKLRRWRKERADARKVEVQVIAPNAVLMAVARSAPRTLEDLGRVEGMDPFRVQQYGQEILTALQSATQQQLL